MIFSFIQHHPYFAPSLFELGKAAAAILSTAATAAFLPRLLENRNNEPSKPRKPAPCDNNLDFGDMTRLRLRSPEIKPFNGHNLSWESWSTCATSTFISTGFGDVIADDYDGSTPRLSQMVFAQILNACQGGDAEWLVS